MDALSPGAGQPAVVARRGPLRRFGAWYRRHVWAATALLILLVAVAGFAALQVAAWGKVGIGVAVAGQRLEGLDRREAAAMVAFRLVDRPGEVRLDLGEAEPLTLSFRQLGITVDPEATAQRALEAGRTRLPLGLSAVAARRRAGRRPRRPRRRDRATRRASRPCARRSTRRPATRGSSSAAERVAVVAGRGRARGRRGRARARPRWPRWAPGAATPARSRRRVVRPEVSTVDAEARASAAAAYLARPVTLRYRSKAVTLTPAQMAGMLSVNTGGDADQYPLTFHNERAAEELHRIFAFAETPPVDATVEVNDDGTVNVTESRSGMLLDMPVLMDELDDAATGGGLRTIFVALTPAFPELSTADVENMGLSSLGSQFVTYFDPRNTSRATNIALAAKLVDGAVVEPGETFSLNAAMGPRTANRGFDYAPVIAADGVLRQGVGGGICQYATTLFNAVFFAGLPVVEREAHSLYISHYPIGRDATVAWGAVDFKFRNDTGRSVMIRSWIDGGALTVALVGKTGRTVDLHDQRLLRYS